MTGRRYPAGRLVLPPAAALVNLINTMQQVDAALTHTGFVKAQPPGDRAPRSGAYERQLAFAYKMDGKASARRLFEPHIPVDLGLAKPARAARIKPRAEPAS